MGGPMSVNDEQRFAWLGAEKRLVADAIRSGKTVVGICLGAQLIASACGSRVTAGNKEIGWYPVRRCLPAPSPGPLSSLPGSFAALHWHGETFELPAGAVRLAETDACPNQAFQLGPRVLGLQFHLEIGVEGVRALLEHASGDLTAGPWVQSPEEIVHKTHESRAAASGHLDRVLDAITAS
jgi:GMP synthase-like glutamine amidotransferase